MEDSPTCDGTEAIDFEKWPFPDWPHWEKEQFVSIFQAVSLSLGIEPYTVLYSEFDSPQEWLYSFPSRWRMLMVSRLLQAKTFSTLTEEEEELRIVKGEKEGLRKGTKLVRLTVFAEWAKDRGWILPEKFPTDKLRIKRISETEVKITFPYEVPILKAIAKVMHQFKEKKDTSEPLDQQAAKANLIEEMSHLKSSLPPRAAQDLATLIQPLDANKDRRKKPNKDKAKEPKKKRR
jgi:hypothetical protein